MQASQIIVDVRRELLETTGSFWSDSELLRLINRAQQDFINKTRLSEDSAKLTLEIGRRDYPLPANYLSSQAVFYNDIDSNGDSNWRRLSSTTLEKMSQETANFLSTDESRRGTPKKYWIWNKTLYLESPPEVVSFIWLFYKSKPVYITDSNQSLEIDDSLVEAVIAYVLWKAWSKEQETDLATTQAAIYLSYIKEGLKWLKKKNGDVRYRFDVESPFGIGGNASLGFDPFNT